MFWLFIPPSFLGSRRRIPMLGQPTPSSKGVFCTFWDKHGLMWVSQTGSKSKPWQRSLIIFMQGILLFVYQNTIFSCKLWTIGHCASLYYRRVAALIGNANNWNQTIWCESFQNDFIRHIPKYLYLYNHTCESWLLSSNPLCDSPGIFEHRRPCQWRSGHLKQIGSEPCGCQDTKVRNDQLLWTHNLISMDFLI